MNRIGSVVQSLSPNKFSAHHAQIPMPGRCIRLINKVYSCNEHGGGKGLQVLHYLINDMSAHK